ncbi:MAG: protein kinase, partial [Muribaculaceae bacterium]|nr:protein kinase [Muribaculaceae bacterium]
MPEIKNALVPGTLLTSGQQTYRVVKTLGAGGFGITYLVEAQVVEGDNVHSFFYAMKEHFLGRCCERIEGSSKVVYSNPVADEVQNSQRDFVAEAVRLQKLGSRHDNIVKVREIFEANNTAYYIMEYLQGNSLRDYVKQRGALSEQEMLSLTTPILDAIGFLHANRMTHLDIKPENIMLTPDPTGKPRPVLIDFGLSKHYDGEGRPT